jgi:prepilin-type processing-associated H-X9-DG protein
VKVGFGSLATGSSQLATDRDWPQFHGPRRDSICRDTGLLKRWPENGPELLWKIDKVGRGYSSISIADGRLFTMADRRDGDMESQFVIAYDLANRRQLWATRVGRPHDDGPRCVPTVSGGQVYALGTDGDLLCMEAATGNVRWRRNLVADFGGKMMSGWKYSESPLVDGDKVICTPGGADAMLVALDKQSGSAIWKSAVPQLGPNGRDGAAYSSIVIAEIDGVRQYVQMIGRGVVGVDAATGRYLWGYNRIASRTANITHPLVRGNLVFATNSYGMGAALLRISRDGQSFKAEEVYFLPARTFENHHGGVVLVGDYLYGGSGENRGEPVCIEFATGKVAWRARAPERGSAAVLYADGHVLFRYDRGPIVMVEATPPEFRI